MTFIGIAARALITVSFLWLILRMSGKRGIYAVRPLDLLIAFVLGNLAHDVIIGRTSLGEGSLALGIILWAHLLVSAVSRRSARLNAWMHGAAVTIIEDGLLQYDAIARERISERSLQTLLREAGVAKIRDVQALTLEPDGSWRLLRREETQPLTRHEVVNARRNSREETPWQRAA